MNRRKDSFILHKYFLKSTSGTISALESTSIEKHGFMFISWAVYNPLKFEFNLCRNHGKGTHGYVSEYIKVFAELNWKQLMTKNHFMTILHDCFIQLMS